LTERAEGLRALLDRPPAPPRPVHELRARVDGRRRRRARVRVGVAGLAVVAAAGVAVPLLDRPSDRATQVVAGPGPTMTTVASPVVSAGSRVDVAVPDGWTKVYAAGDRAVVSTRPLSDADRELALLARDDVAFRAFPADAVVVVVGGDPTQPKYTKLPGGGVVAAGPAYGLGDETTMADGVRVRRGDVPQSGVRIASYAGAVAPNNRLREAEGIAAGVRLVPGDTPSVPPPGSRPGLPNGALPVAEDGLPEVARTPASGSTLILLAGQNCAYLEWVDSQRSAPGHQPLAGACGAAPSTTGIESFGSPTPVMRGPGTTAATVAFFRSGSQIRRVTARLVDGRSVDAVVGADGWGLVATESRVVALTGYDVNGRAFPEVRLG